jgi:hypothetical protein
VQITIPPPWIGVPSRKHPGHYGRREALGDRVRLGWRRYELLIAMLERGLQTVLESTLPIRRRLEFSTVEEVALAVGAGATLNRGPRLAQVANGCRHTAQRRGLLDLPDGDGDMLPRARLFQKDTSAQTHALAESGRADCAARERPFARAHVKSASRTNHDAKRRDWRTPAMAE